MSILPSRLQVGGKLIPFFHKPDATGSQVKTKSIRQGMLALFIYSYGGEQVLLTQSLTCCQIYSDR